LKTKYITCLAILLAIWAVDYLGFFVISTPIEVVVSVLMLPMLGWKKVFIIIFAFTTMELAIAPHYVAWIWEIFDTKGIGFLSMPFIYAMQYWVALLTYPTLKKKKRLIHL